MDKALTCWVISDGKAGMRNQCIGLAERMGLAWEEKVVRLRAPWKQLSPSILRIGNHLANTADSTPIAPPWPDVVIATGRHSVATSLAIRTASPRTFRIQIQNPGIRPALFDFIITPRHDRLSASNVMTSRGGLHGLTAERLTDAARRAPQVLLDLPKPRIAVLVGGDNGVYRLDRPTMEKLADNLAGLARQGYGLMITPSRRTGAENEALLREKLTGLPAFVWDGSGDNPYLPMLGLADAVIATCDSVNMVTEASVTGKPIHVVDLPGGSDKFTRFHDGLRKDGITRPFRGMVEEWNYTPTDDTGDAAREAWRLIQARDTK